MKLNYVLILCSSLPSLGESFNPIHRIMEHLFDAKFKKLITDVLAPFLLVFSNGPTGIVAAHIYLLTPFITPLMPEFARPLLRFTLGLVIDLILFLLNLVLNLVYTILLIVFNVLNLVTPIFRRTGFLKASGTNIKGMK